VNQQRFYDSYFLIDAGHPRAVFMRPTDPKELPAWDAWLRRGLAAIAISLAVALFWNVGGTIRPLEATVQMERLAAKMEQTKVIHPDAVRAILRFVDQNGYDCDHVVCNTQLRARNRAVRSNLQKLIAERTPASDVAGISKQDPLSIDAARLVRGEAQVR
jgi:hypothetical protein